MGRIHCFHFWLIFNKSLYEKNHFYTALILDRTLSLLREPIFFNITLGAIACIGTYTWCNALWPEIRNGQTGSANRTVALYITRQAFAVSTIYTIKFIKETLIRSKLTSKLNLWIISGTKSFLRIPSCYAFISPKVSRFVCKVYVIYETYCR